VLAIVGQADGGTEVIVSLLTHAKYLKLSLKKSNEALPLHSSIQLPFLLFQG
jgi:hypothetical protein